MIRLVRALGGFLAALTLGAVAHAQVLSGPFLSYPLLAPDGTTGAPSYAFSAEPTTGLARSASGQIDIVLSGIARERFTTAGFRLRSDGAITWTSGVIGAASDTTLGRFSAGVLGLTNTAIAFTGTIPTVTGTGTPSITTGSTDTSGQVTAGASATSVVITFATAKANAPFCVVTSQTQLAAFAYTVSTSAITVTQTATSGNLINYICTQR
jgi:hypothetical protein